MARPIAAGMPHPAASAQAGSGGHVGREIRVREMTTEAPQGVQQNPAYRSQS